MSAIVKNLLPKSTPIHEVLVYRGHQKSTLLGPYHENIRKRIEMFQHLNQYREQAWKVIPVAGEELIERLKKTDLEKALLVVPAGQSTTLDKVFSAAETTFLKSAFLQGLRGYVNCGSAYWTAAKRIYHGFTEANRETLHTVIKPSNLPLFQGVAEGPLCPFPGKQYKVGFYSDAVEITDGITHCTIYLSGGGSFHLPAEHSSERTKVLARYQLSELIRLGKKPEEAPKWQNAAVMSSYGKGAILSSMFHPYYGAKDFDIARYEAAFPNCGTDWRAVKARLSPLSQRMKLAANMLTKLETMDFS